MAHNLYLKGHTQYQHHNLKLNVRIYLINLYNPSQNCNLDFIPHVSRDMNINISLNNSFGFGGTNSALLFKKFD